MEKSKYEKYIVRKPGMIIRVGDDYVDKIPETDKIPLLKEVNTSPRVVFSGDLITNAKTKVEYGYTTGDTAIGTEEDFVPHEHDFWNWKESSNYLSPV